MAAGRCLAILGDSTALVPDGFVHHVTEALHGHEGLEVVNWSVEDQTATAWATDQLEELQGKIKHVKEAHKDLFVVVALGSHDRVILGELLEMLEMSLGMLVRVMVSMDARPIIMQVVPDDIDQKVAQDMGVAFVPAPHSVVAQYAAEPASPFVPKPECYGDMATNLLHVLDEELKRPMRRFAGHEDNDFMTRGSYNPGPFDGTWMHKDVPSMIELISNNVIVSADGNQTLIHPDGQNGFFIEQDGHQIHAELRGTDLRWSDGDIWSLIQDSPMLGRPPIKYKIKDLTKILSDTWEMAEQACVRTQEETEKGELKLKRERLAAEHAELQAARSKLEAARATLHKETEHVSALREVAGG